MDSYERQVRLRLQSPDAVLAEMLKAAYAFGETSPSTPNGYFVPSAVAAAARGTPSEAHLPTPPGTKKRKNSSGYETTWYLADWNIPSDLIASVQDRASWKLISTDPRVLDDEARARLSAAGLVAAARDGAGSWAARAHRLLFDSGPAGHEIARSFAPAHRMLREWLLAHLVHRLAPSNGEAAVQSTLDQLLGRSLYGSYAPDFVNFFLNATKILQFSYVAQRRNGRDHANAWASSFARLFGHHEGLVWAHQLAQKTLFNSPTQRRLARGQSAVDANTVLAISERALDAWPWLHGIDPICGSTAIERHAAIWAVLSGLAVARREQGKLPRAGSAFHGWRYFDQIVHAAALFRLVAVELTRPEDDLPWLEDDSANEDDAIAAFDELTRKMAPIVKATLSEDEPALRAALTHAGHSEPAAQAIAERALPRIEAFVDWLEPEVAKLSKSSTDEKPARPRPFLHAERKEAP